MKDDKVDAKESADAGSEEMTDEQIWAEITGKAMDEDPEPEPDDDPEDIEDNAEAEDASQKSEASDDAESETLESLQKQIEKLTQQRDSEKGRARGLNKKYEKLLSDYRAVTAQIEALRSDPDPAEQESLDKAREEYGDVLDPVLKKISRSEEANRRLAEVQAERQKSLEQERDEFLREQFTAFQAEHPKGVEFLKKNSDKFLAWVNDQPAEDRRVYQENREHIVDGAAAALLVSKFKAHLAAANGQGNRPDPNAARRQRQMAGARSVRSPSSQVVTSDNTPSDDAGHEQLFKFWANKKR